MKNVNNLLNDSKTAFHAVFEASNILETAGFVKLDEQNAFTLKKGGKYYVTRNDSALIAFVIPTKTNKGFRIVASHTDSPCFKVKLGKNPTVAGCTTLYVEQYGGGLRYTWFDRPLKLCGRLCGVKDGKVISALYESKQKFVIPSLAIHYNRSANDGIPFNVQTDCQPIYSLDCQSDELINDLKSAFDGELLDCDLFLVSDETPFFAGKNDELLCAPRIDNLTSCFASIEALLSSNNENYTTLCYLADNEEIGSRTKQGAASDFLSDILKRIIGYGEDYHKALSKSFLVSCDNAHATHPCHANLADGSSEVYLGKGIIIKHHANMNYTTDGFSAAVFKNVLKNANVPYSDFYMRADLPCGGTLGAISSASVSVASVDIGIAQLAMHSAVETFAVKDYYAMTDGLKAFFNTVSIS